MVKTHQEVDMSKHGLKSWYELQKSITGVQDIQKIWFLTF
jgi:hypothetical protein